VENDHFLYEQARLTLQPLDLFSWEHLSHPALALVLDLTVFTSVDNWRCCSVEDTSDTVVWWKP
jgi:hypothetical protein